MGKVLVLTIKDKAVLQAAYMSLLQEGGLFIPTNRSLPMGEEISMLLTLMGESEKLPVRGTVVWITPKESEGNRTPGFGLQFKGEAGKMLNHIGFYVNRFTLSSSSH